MKQFIMKLLYHDCVVIYYMQVEYCFTVVKYLTYWLIMKEYRLRQKSEDSQIWETCELFLLSKEKENI